MTVSRKLYERKDGALVYTVVLRRGSHYVPEYWTDYDSMDIEFIQEEIMGKLPKVGHTYVVGERRHIYNENRVSIVFKAFEENRDGWEGNADISKKRFHGWRGTTDDVAFYGHGIRKCLSVTSRGKWTKTIRVEFGKDIYSELP